MSEMTEQQLIELLEQLDRGKTPEEIISTSPVEDAQVLATLNIVDSLTKLSSRPYVSAKQASRHSFLAQATGIESVLLGPRQPSGTWRRLFQGLAFAAVALMLLFLTTSILAGRALPGDFLYGPKLAMENARMSLTEDPSAILDLSNKYQAQRADEVKALLRLGRTAEVEFEGIITGISANQLNVAGVIVLIGDETQIEGRPQIEELTRVKGFTEDGKLFARFIVVLTGTSLPEVIEEKIEPSQTPVRPTLASERPLGERNTATPTASTTPTPSPSPTLVPAPTTTITPSPVPTLDDDSGGGDDDPLDSDKPDDPDDPDEPDKPDEPEDPDEPDEPDESGDPENPDEV